MEALYERMERAEAQAAKAAQEAEDAAMPDPWWRRFLDSDWTKIIVGGVIVLIIGIIIGKIL